MTTTKFCKTCGKIMWDVQLTKRYCDSCIHKRHSYIEYYYERRIYEDGTFYDYKYSEDE